MNEKILWQNDDERRRLEAVYREYRAVIRETDEGGHDCITFRSTVYRGAAVVQSSAATHFFGLLDWTEGKLIELAGGDDGAEHEHIWYADAAHNVFCQICGLEKWIGE